MSYAEAKVTFIICLFVALAGAVIEQRLDATEEAYAQSFEVLNDHIEHVRRDMDIAQHTLSQRMLLGFEHTVTSLDTRDDIEVACLARNIYFEARNEPIEGMIAVAEVTHNRVEADQFPNSFCGVVLQARKSGQGMILINQCQFSWYCDDIPDVVANRPLYNRIYDMAEQYYAYRDYSVDITGGALYYHNTTVAPRWSYTFTRVAQIGQHIFYRPE